MKQWHASITYDEKNAIRLAKVIERNFHYKRRLVLFLVGFGLIVLGFALGIQNTNGLFSLAMGSLLLTNTDALARNRARTIISQLKGYTPKMHYTFSEKDFQGYTERESNTFAFDQLIRIMDDGGFLYLFKEKGSAFMVDKKTMQPAECRELMGQISAETRLSWIRFGNRLNTGLITLIRQHYSPCKKHTSR